MKSSNSAIAAIPWRRHIKEPRGMKLLKNNDEVNFYNFTDKDLSTLIFDTFTKRDKSCLHESLFLLYAVQIIQSRKYSCKSTNY